MALDPGQLGWASTRNVHDSHLSLYHTINYYHTNTLWPLPSICYNLLHHPALIPVLACHYPRLFWNPQPQKLCISFTQSSSSFFKPCPYHLNLFHWTVVAMSSTPNLCLNATQDNLFLNPSPYIQLIILIFSCCNAIAFSLFIGHISCPCSVLHLMQNVPSQKASRTHL